MAAGDETARCELLARYRHRIYATAYAALLDPEQVEAVVADVFARARHEATRFLRTAASVSGWLTYLTRLATARVRRPPRLIATRRTPVR